MTDKQLADRYDHYLFTGTNTQEKHIRYMAEEITKEYAGGFAGRERPPIYRVPWRVRRNQISDDSGWIDIPVSVPLGMHGFALQLVIEDQLREAILP